MSAPISKSTSWAAAVALVGALACTPAQAQPRANSEGESTASADRLQPQWATRLKSAGTPTALTVAGSTVIVVDGKGGITSVSTETGTVNWTKKSPTRPSADTKTRVAAHGRTIAVAWPSSTAIEGIDADTGRTLWRREVGAVITGLVDCGREPALVASHRADSGGTDLVLAIHALSPQTGETLWLEGAVGPAIDGLDGWIFAQDRRLGTEYRMDAHRCRDGAASTLEFNPGTVWRLFETNGTELTLEVSYNAGTVFEICAQSLDIGPSDSARPEPRCRDVAHMGPEHHRLTGAVTRGETTWLSLAPPTGSSEPAGRVIQWHWKRHKRLASSAEATSNLRLIKQGRWIAAAWAESRRKQPSWLRFLESDSLLPGAELALDARPVDFTTDGARIYVALEGGSIVAVGWPAGTSSNVRPTPSAIEPRPSTLRLVSQ